MESSRNDSSMESQQSFDSYLFGLEQSDVGMSSMPKSLTSNNYKGNLQSDVSWCKKIFFISNCTAYWFKLFVFMIYLLMRFNIWWPLIMQKILTVLLHSDLFFSTSDHQTELWRNWENILLNFMLVMQWNDFLQGKRGQCLRCQTYTVKLEYIDSLFGAVVDIDIVAIFGPKSK